MAFQKQLSGFSNYGIHGGESSRGRRKVRRPVVTKRAMHFVVRSSLAVGSCSMLSKLHSRFVNQLVYRLAGIWEVRLLEFSNNGNHLHMVIRCKTVEGYRNFSRVLTALIARRITGAKKGVEAGIRFWDSIPYTRVLEHGRALVIARNYVRQNRLEAAGRVPYHPRNSPVPLNVGVFAPSG